MADLNTIGINNLVDESANNLVDELGNHILTPSKIHYAVTTDKLKYFYQKLKNIFALKKHSHTKSEITDFPNLGTASNKNTKTLSAKGAAGWTNATTDQQYVPDMAFMAYWNGAYSGTSSNLTYCTKGAFGTAATKNTGDFATASHSHDLSTMINRLSTGTSAPQDSDYYVSQYVGGGTTTTTYHRRPMSALWTYIKSKADSVYQPKGTYAKYSLTTDSGLCREIKDWNTATTCGFYYGNSASNSPVDGKWFYGVTIAFTTEWIRQSVFQFGVESDLSKAQTSRYERVKHDGKWGKWIEIY